MKKNYVRNMHGVKIKMCCASCKERLMTSDRGRVCGLNGCQVFGCQCCEHWEMEPLLQNAGMSGGQIKSRRYLRYYRERWTEQREALMTKRIQATELLTREDIRREYEQEYGSIYINF